MSTLLCLNFYSPVFVDQLRRGRKTATIRLGNKSRKYEEGQIVWVTVGFTGSPREKIFSAVIEDVEVKKVADLSPREVERDNPEFRRVEETISFLEQIYNRSIGTGDTVTVVHFAQIIERPTSQYGNGETPSRN
ncbi:MAG: ASCH domain-containing protein [Solirubrobacterales bacterium]